MWEWRRRYYLSETVVRCESKKKKRGITREDPKKKELSGELRKKKTSDRANEEHPGEAPFDSRQGRNVQSLT